jgi:plasmid stabilization system protein ParE
MNVRYSDEALQMLAGAMVYIARDSPSAARRTRVRIEQAVARLLDFPESGRLVPSWTTAQRGK